MKKDRMNVTTATYVTNKYSSISVVRMDLSVN
jgi:hypothetical protein